METFSGLDPWWLTGFCDGEASFTYSRSGRQLALYFAVKLSDSDRGILEELQSYFACGTIYTVKARAPTSSAGATKTAALYRVTRHDDLPRITEHFDRYPLRSQKAASYRIWRAMVEIKRDFRGRNREALEELALALTATVPSKQSWR